MAKGIKAIKRVTKKELKEDKWVTSVIKAQKWILERQALLLKVGGGVVIVIVLLSFWLMSKSHAQAEATYKLGLAILAEQSGQVDAALQQYEEVVKQYPGTRSGDKALYYSAELKRRKGQKDEALKAFDEFLKRGGDSYLRAAAWAGKGTIFEDRGDYQRAADCYLEAVKVKSGFFAEPSLRLDAARCLRLAGQTAKAREQCQYILDHHPATSYAQRAEQEMLLLG
jgi:tetratricopeptide (TPR) repeat protein